MKAKDGKYYLTNFLDTEGIFRFIKSVPSHKAEVFCTKWHDYYRKDVSYE